MEEHQEGLDSPLCAVELLEVKLEEEGSTHQRNLESLASGEDGMTKNHAQPKDPEGSLKQKRQRRRNMGQEYISDKTKQLVPARIMGPPCDCHKNCRAKLGEEADVIFHSFWNIASFDAQNAHLFSLIKTRNKKRSYPKKTKRSTSLRKITAEYSVIVDGKKLQVCKSEFLSVHGLQKSRGRVENIVNQVASGSIAPRPDGRGRHANRRNKVPEEMVQSVRDHVESIPTYQNRFSLQSNPGKVYYDIDSSIAGLYRDYYVPFCKERKITPVSEDKYRRIFYAEYNIGFRLPYAETCKFCDVLQAEIEASKCPDEKLQCQKEFHQSQAEAVRHGLQSEASIVRTCSDILVISISLQPALPVPKLGALPAFYKRKIWVYTLSIFDHGRDTGCLYVWPEEVARRRSDEICSAILKHIATRTDIKRFVCYSDACADLLRNWTIVALWLLLVRENKLDAIEHRYFLPGHSHLPSNKDFLVVERYRRNHESEIYSPQDWVSFLKINKTTHRFEVQELEREDFYNVSAAFEHVPENVTTIDGSPVHFSEVTTFRFEACRPHLVFVKLCLNENFMEIDMRKQCTMALSSLKQKYFNTIGISVKKLSEIQSLLPFVPTFYHDYYAKLAVNREEESGSEMVD